jgi:hypothetical protein
MELNLRLDEQGRTSFDPVSTPKDCVASGDNSNASAALDYDTTTVIFADLAALATNGVAGDVERDNKKEETGSPSSALSYDALLLDCEVSYRKAKGFYRLGWALILQFSHYILSFSSISPPRLQTALSYRGLFGRILNQR